MSFIDNIRSLNEIKKKDKYLSLSANDLHLLRSGKSYLTSDLKEKDDRNFIPLSYVDADKFFNYLIKIILKEPDVINFFINHREFSLRYRVSDHDEFIEFPN